MRRVIKPTALGFGDTIGIAAPASPFDEKAFEEGVTVLKDMGFDVRIPEEIFRRHGYLAGSDEERAAQLMRLFEDDSVRAVFCARGGYGSMRILPLIDFDAIRRHPKILVGFSDITALLAALYRYCGIVTFHGPLVTTLRHRKEQTTAALMDAITSHGHLVLSPPEPVVLSAGTAYGPVAGGNLTSLCHLLGTPYEPALEGHILFLEDRGEAPYRIDRMLWQLRLAGRLDTVSGVALGSFDGCEPLEQVYSIVKEAFNYTGVPILAGFDVGHGSENLTLPIGVEAELDTAAGVLRYREPALR